VRSVKYKSQRDKR